MNMLIYANSRPSPTREPTTDAIKHTWRSRVFCGREPKPRVGKKQNTIVPQPQDVTKTIFVLSHNKKRRVRGGHACVRDRL